MTQMTNTDNPIDFPVELESSKRVEMIDRLAAKWTDNMDTDALMDFFFEHQVEYLEDQTDEDLKVIYDEEFNDD